MFLFSISGDREKERKQLQSHDGVLGLGVCLCDALAHEVEEGELRGAGAELVDEARGEVGAEDGAEVVVWDLWGVLVWFVL